MLAPPLFDGTFQDKVTLVVPDAAKFVGAEGTVVGGVEKGVALASPLRLLSPTLFTAETL